MPTINKPKKKQVKQGRSKEASEIYNNSRWKKLRNAYLMQHPLCEECLRLLDDGIIDISEVQPTKEIHHINPILTGESRLEMEELAYDGNNLMALCQHHHHQLHNNLKNTIN